MNSDYTDSKLKAAEEAVKRLEVFHPDSMELVTALENYAFLLRSQKRLLDAANVKARADVIRAKLMPPPLPPAPQHKPSVAPPQKVIVRKYVGNESEAASAFQNDAPKMAAYNYYPTSQVWAPGSYGCATFLLALLLVLFVVGILIFIYMLLVKPSGTLTVTYELREPAVVAEPQNERTCPSCAETIKAAAVICRFCNRNVDPIVIPPRESLESIAYTPPAEPLINEAPAKTKSIWERPINLDLINELFVGNATTAPIAHTRVVLLLCILLGIISAINFQFKAPSEPQAASTAESQPAVPGIESQARRAQLCRERLADMRDAILNHDWRKAKEHLGVALAHAEESGDTDLVAKVRKIQQDFYAQGYAP